MDLPMDASELPPDAPIPRTMALSSLMTRTKYQEENRTLTLLDRSAKGYKLYMLTTKTLNAPSWSMQSKHKPSPKVNQHWQPKMVSHSWMVLKPTRSTTKDPLPRIHYQRNRHQGITTKESLPEGEKV
eukprot:11945339-Ditylum_brightwellii.AAC.1